MTRRLNGKRISLNLVPWFKYSRQTIDGYFPESYSGYGLNGSIQYLVEKNTSQYLGTELYISALNYIGTEDHDILSTTGVNGQYTLLYNPNSRTTMEIGANILLALNNFEDVVIKSNVPFRFNYFINNKARIRGDFNISWSPNPESVAQGFYDGIYEFNGNFISSINPLNFYYFNSVHYFYGGISFEYSLY